MSGSFSPSGTASLNLTVGGNGALGTGAFTIAILFRFGSGNNNAGFVDMLASSATVRSFFIDTLLLFGHDDFSNGFPASNLSNSTWYLGIITKASGTAQYDFSIWPYASDGSGTMTSGASGNPGTHGDGSTIDAIKLGISEGSVKGNGEIAAAGFWDYQLTQTQRGTMKSNLFQKWYDAGATAPKSLLSLENWDGSTTSTLVDKVGTVTCSSITGTVSSGANPPSFDFSISTGGSGITASDVPGALRWNSALQSAVAAGVTIIDLASTGQRLGRSTEAVTIGVAIQDVIGSGYRLGRSAEAVAFGVTTPDVPISWRLGLGGVETANSATLGPDSTVGGLRWRSADGAGVTFGVAVLDAPSAVRQRSADGSGVSFGVAFADTPFASRLGASLVGVQAGLVVGDTSAPLRWLSANLAQDVATLDAPMAWRWGSGSSSATVNVPGSNVPDVPRIPAPVRRANITAEVNRANIIAEVRRVRA